MALSILQVIMRIIWRAKVWNKLIKYIRANFNLASLKAILVILLLTNTYAHADCDKAFISNIANQIDAKVDEYNYQKLFSCKEIENQGIKVLAFAVYNPELTKIDPFFKGGVENASDGRYDLNVVVVSKDSNKIITKYTNSGVLESDAVALTNVIIDNRYGKLNNHSLILDVTARNAANSHSYISDHTKLFLFEFKKNSLTQLINGLDVYSYHGNIEENPEKNLFENMERTLKFTKKLTNSKPDILISEINCQTNNETGDCKGIANTKKIKHFLKFDGRKYPIPKRLNH